MKAKEWFEQEKSFLSSGKKVEALELFNKSF
jgi:hypothetical protein